jgi:hypothetical protein
MAQRAIAGLRGTGQFDENTRPTNWRETFTLLEPNGTAPLNALLSFAHSTPTDDPKYNHFRDELPSRVLKVATAATDAATSIVVTADDNVPFVVENATLYNTRTGEVMRATADANTGTNTLTVARGAGGDSTKKAVTVGDELVIIGYAAKEGSGKPSVATFDPTTDYNYTQIFKTGVSITGTLKQTYLRTGDKESEMLTKALKNHMADIERAFFFGQRAIEDANTATPRRYTGGLFSMIPNVIDAASAFENENVITEYEFDRLLIEDLFAWGSKEKVMFCGPRVISNLMQIAKNRWQPTAVDNAYGVSFARYHTFAGDLLVYMHPLFRQIPSMNANGIILDMDALGYRYMNGRDTTLKRDVQANDVDASEHFYITECGLELLQAKPHAIIRNWKDVKASKATESEGGGASQDGGNQQGG